VEQQMTDDPIRRSFTAVYELLDDISKQIDATGDVDILHAKANQLFDLQHGLRIADRMAGEEIGHVIRRLRQLWKQRQAA
jgi:hypothetical protein